MLSLHLQLYSFILVILVCLLFLLPFFCFNDQKQATSSPTHISPSHQKWQNITRSWPKMDLSSYVEPLCVCVCQVGLWFLSTRMSQHANSFVNFTLFCVESFGTIIQKLLKRRENYNKKPIYGTENMVLNKYFLKKF